MAEEAGEKTFDFEDQDMFLDDDYQPPAEPEGAAKEPAEGEAPPEPQEGPGDDDDDGEVPEAEEAPAEAAAAEPKAPEPPPPAPALTEEILNLEVEYKADGADAKGTVRELLEAGKEAVQLTAGARRNMEEAANLKKASARVLELIVEDPLQTSLNVLKRHFADNGSTPEEAEAQWWSYLKQVVYHRVQTEKKLAEMPPEVREYYQRAEQLQAREAQLERERAAIQKERMTVAEKAEADRIDRDLDDAIKATGIPDDPETLETLLRTCQRHWDAGQNLTFLDAARKVKADLERRKVQPAAVSPEEIARNPKMLEAIRQAELKLKAQQPATHRADRRPREGAARPDPRKRSSGAKTRISASEYFDSDD